MINIVAIDYYDTIRADYLVPFNNNEVLLRSKLTETLHARPLVNKFGVELPFNEYNTGIDLLEWLVDTSWLFFLKKLISEIAPSILRSGGGVLTTAKKDNTTIITIDTGTLSAEEIPGICEKFSDIIATLNGTLKYTKIKTVPKIRKAATGENMPLFKNATEHMVL